MLGNPLLSCPDLLNTNHTVVSFEVRAAVQLPGQRISVKVYRRRTPITAPAVLLMPTRRVRTC